MERQPEVSGNHEKFIEAGSTVLVVGGGRSGIEACLLAQDLGATVSLVDDDRATFETSAWKEVERRGGKALSDRTIGPWISGFPGRVLMSPGVPPVKWCGEVVAPALPSVRGELEWAASLFPAPMIAIGGTNGKSTTTALIAHLLSGVGFRPFVGGNFGTPLSAGSRAFLDAERSGTPAPFDIGVIEVSSFQTESMAQFDPMLFLLLNITPDHLDRYGDFALYRDAKLRPVSLFSSSTTVLWNGDQDDFAKMAPSTRAGAALVSRLKDHDGPRRLPFLEIGPGFLTGRGIPGVTDPVTLSTELFPLEGGGNEENLAFAMLAVLLALDKVGRSPDLSALSDGVATFSGLPHRMEPVDTVRGVTFVNDSKATNVGAVAAALSGLPERESPWIVLILGGRDKGGAYLPLVPGIRTHVRKVVVLGEARTKIREALSPVVPVEEATDFSQAVARAFDLAEPGEMVLLSPACSSYDMFHGYEERGERFREEVQRLKARVGGDLP